jgi:hypothetical protein
MIAANDLNELVELYNCRDGQEKEGTFFSPAQVVDGGYFGIRDNGRLVAAAGTHLISRRESVAALETFFVFPSTAAKDSAHGSPARSLVSSLKTESRPSA